MKPIEKSEAEVEKEIKDALELVGFRVLKTSAKRTKGGYGIDKGIPDRLAFMPGTNLCIGLEIKRSEKAPRKPEQVALNEAGCYIFAHSVESALQGILGVFEGLFHDETQVQVDIARIKTAIERYLKVVTP